MEENVSVTTRSAGIRYGLILGVASIAFFVVMNVAGLDMQGPLSYLGWLITIAVIFFAHKYFKENGDGYMTIGQGIGIGFWTGLVSTFISAPFTYIYIKFIDGAFLENIKDKQIEKMQEQGMSDEQIDQGMKMAEMFMSAEAILIMGIIGGLIMALIFAVIVSLFTKNTPPESI
ncbi:MAG: DUF4199 domain-containing protein [Cytophagales bacterium]|nr:DUF4199 domain-containing protein [Cytophagales bacterium]